MLPKSFSPATWRGVTPVVKETGEIGISFDTEQGPVRLKLDGESAKMLIEGMLDYMDPVRYAELQRDAKEFYERTKCQSPISLGTPNPEVSPQDADAV